MDGRCMNSINKTRGVSGVICSILEMGDGKSRVILDDVSNSSSNEQGPWSHEVIYTQKDYDSKSLQELELSEEEYAAFGHAIFARLCAMQQHPYNKK